MLRRPIARRLLLIRIRQFTLQLHNINDVVCCPDVVHVNTFSRRRSSCLRWSVVRRCATKVILVSSLFVFTLTTMYTSPSSTAAYRDPGDGDTSASSSVALLPPPRVRQTSGTSASMMSALLAMPDCDAIIAGDQAEIASTQRMLFQETRTTLSSFDDSHRLAVNCTPTFQRPVTNMDGSSPLAYIISDAGSSVEQTQLLLRAVYAAANIYCLTFDFCSASDHVAAALRRLTSCFNNIIVVERRHCFRSRDRKRNATTTAWWRCVDRLLRHEVDWTHVVGLTVNDFPLRPRDDIARRLTTEKFDVGRRAGNDVIHCGAYTRSSVSQPSTPLSTREAGYASSITTSQIRSPDGATVAVEVCSRKCKTADNDDGFTNSARCYYTVADLPSLVRQPKLFAHPFDLNVDHYAVRCLMQRIVKQRSE